MSKSFEVNYLYQNAASYIYSENIELFSDPTLTKVEEKDLDNLDEKLTMAINSLIENDIIKDLELNQVNQRNQRTCRNENPYQNTIAFLAKFS